MDLLQWENLLNLFFMTLQCTFKVSCTYWECPILIESQSILIENIPKFSGSILIIIKGIPMEKH